MITNGNFRLVFIASDNFEMIENDNQLQTKFKRKQTRCKQRVFSNVAK